MIDHDIGIKDYVEYLLGVYCAHCGAIPKQPCAPGKYKYHIARQDRAIKLRMQDIMHAPWYTDRVADVDYSKSLVREAKKYNV